MMHALFRSQFGQSKGPSLNVPDRACRFKDGREWDRAHLHHYDLEAIAQKPGRIRCWPKLLTGCHRPGSAGSSVESPGSERAGNRYLLASRVVCWLPFSSLPEDRFIPFPLVAPRSKLVPRPRLHEMLHVREGLADNTTGGRQQNKKNPQDIALCVACLCFTAHTL